MTLNRTLERVFRTIRGEVARNPAFAAELEAALRDYRPRRGPPRPIHSPNLPARAQPVAAWPAPQPSIPPKVQEAEVLLPPLNPIAFARREGVDALRRELLSGSYDEAALRALLHEHNLDPAGEAQSEPVPDLVERLTQQAQRRLERDQKLFAY